MSHELSRNGSPAPEDCRGAPRLHCRCHTSMLFLSVLTEERSSFNLPSPSPFPFFYRLLLPRHVFFCHRASYALRFIQEKISFCVSTKKVPNFPQKPYLWVTLICQCPFTMLVLSFPGILVAGVKPFPHSQYACLMYFVVNLGQLFRPRFFQRRHVNHVKRMTSETIREMLIPSSKVSIHAAPAPAGLHFLSHENFHPDFPVQILPRTYVHPGRVSHLCCAHSLLSGDT